jgi:hypothetical protein
MRDPQLELRVMSTAVHQNLRSRRQGNESVCELSVQNCTPFSANSPAGALPVGHADAVRQAIFMVQPAGERRGDELSFEPLDLTMGLDNNQTRRHEFSSDP